MQDKEAEEAEKEEQEEEAGMRRSRKRDLRKMLTMCEVKCVSALKMYLCKHMYGRVCACRHVH